MKTKSLVVFFSFLVLCGVTASIFFGLKPKPIPKIRLSSFESPAKLAQAIELRLNEEIKNSSILAIGYQPEKLSQLGVVKELYRAGVAEIWISDENLDIPTEISTEKVNSQQNFKVLGESLTKAVSEKKKVALILPAIYSSQLLPGNIVNRLKRDYHLSITSLSIVELLRSREEEKSVIIPCLVTDTDNIGTGSLGCAVLQQGRGLYRKKMEAGKKVAVVDQRGERDYLIFYSNEEEK